jgi:hypothetical protein
MRYYNITAPPYPAQKIGPAELANALEQRIHRAQFARSPLGKIINRQAKIIRSTDFVKQI